jgi:4-amino-4-deoxy-L-arabinose transferase-like glycosyltransferase
MLIVILSLVIAILGLPLDLILPDATLYGMISKEMYLTNDYINLYSLGYDWLDKPHLPFWLTALSFKIFGVSNFSYKLPGILVFFLGVYYTFKFAFHNYGKQTAWISVAILCTSFHSILSNFDVRAEPYLTGFIIASLYYFDRFVREKSFKTLLFASFFAGLAIMTKGIFAILPIAFGLGGHFLFKRDWKGLLNPLWLVAIALILLCITPELYSLYVQFDLQPDKVVFDQQNVSGLRFFFWDSQFGRFFNTAPIKGSGDVFFFLHTLLWAFLPWGILFYIAIVYKLKVNFKRKEKEMMTWFGSILTILIFSLSKFQLAHYTNIIFPFMAIICADFISNLVSKKGALKNWIIGIQSFTIVVILGATFGVLMLLDETPNFVFFGFILLSLLALVFMIKKTDYKIINIIWISSVVSFIMYAFLMTHFYPSILPYQSGAQAARIVNEQYNGKGYLIDNKTRRFDFEFYLDNLVKRVKIENINEATDAVFYSNSKELEELNELGVNYQILKEIDSYPISRISLLFLDPEKRAGVLEKKYLIQIRN